MNALTAALYLVPLFFAPLAEDMADIRYWPLSRSDYTQAPGDDKTAVDRNGPIEQASRHTPNAIIDYAELRMIDVLLRSPAHPLHQRLAPVWQHNYRQMRIELIPFVDRCQTGALPGTHRQWARVMALYVTLGDPDSFALVRDVLEEFSLIIDPADYDLTLAPLLAPDGDADADGLTNLQEYQSVFAHIPRESLREPVDLTPYLRAVLGHAELLNLGLDADAPTTASASNTTSTSTRQGTRP